MASKTMTLGSSSVSVDLLVANGNVVGNNIKSKGNATTPIYFDANGVATPCSVSSGEDVIATETQNGLMSAEMVQTLNGLAGGGGNEGFVLRSGDAMEGNLLAATVEPTMNGVRNISAGTTALTSGTSTLATGDIYIQYV